MYLGGLSQFKMIFLLKNIQKLLTFCLNYAKINIQYSGIVGYFPATKNKKQKQKALLSRIKAFLRVNLLAINLTFCFLPKRFFVEKIAKTINKNKNKKYDCRALSSLRHIESNRPEQNHLDSLGATRFNPQSPKRQSRVALLQQKSSRSDYQYGQTDQLFPKSIYRSNQLKTVLMFLGFYFFQINQV